MYYTYYIIFYINTYYVLSYPGKKTPAGGATDTRISQTNLKTTPAHKRTTDGGKRRCESAKIS